MSGCMNRVQVFFSLDLVFIITPSCVIVLSSLIRVWGEWHFLACMCSQTFERSSKAFVLWCWGMEGTQTSLFWCPLNVKMSKVIADENKRQTSFAPDRRKTFPTHQIKSQARDQIGKGDTVSVMKFTHPWETQESKLTSNVALWHTADRSFLNTEKMFFLLWIISSCFPAESRNQCRTAVMNGERVPCWVRACQHDPIRLNKTKYWSNVKIFWKLV